MAVYSTKLSVQDAAFPLLSMTSGRPAFINMLDVPAVNEAAPNGLASNASSVFYGVAKPHIIYAENVLPRAHGFNSVGFLELHHVNISNAQNAYLMQIRNMGALANVSEDCSLVFFKDNVQVSYFTKNLNGTINTINSKADIISQGNVSGIQFILFAFNTVSNRIQLNEVRIKDDNSVVEFKPVYDIDSGLIPSGISIADFQEIKFCCGAGNYLILAKQDGTIYWNDPSMGQYIPVDDATGFTVNEIITGATSGNTATVLSLIGTKGIYVGLTATGDFTIGETITGGTSSTTDTVSAAAVDAPDFTPSLITGAGFQIPSAMSGQCIGLQSLGDGFIIHTTTGSIFGRYSNNVQYPWIFQPCWNSAPIHNSLINTMLTSTDSPLQSQQFVWGDSGLMQISVLSNAQALFPEVSDFIAGQMLEILSNNSISGVPQVINPAINAGAIDMALARIDNRYLCISYGHFNPAISSQQVFTQCLVYDIALKRWGKLVVDHVAVIKLPDSFPGVADVHEIGIISPTGSILAVTEQVYSVINGVPQTVEHNGVLIVSGINFIRGNPCSINSVDIHFGQINQLPDVNAENMELGYSNSPDSISLIPFVSIPITNIGVGSAKWQMLKTAQYHSVKLKGNFKISHLEVEMFKAGSR